MPDTLPAPAPSSEVSWAKPAIAMGVLSMFVAMVGAAYMTQDHVMIALLGGAVVGMASQVGNYYYGSSSGSARKAELLAAIPGSTP